MNRNHILNGIRSVHFTIAYSELVYLFPQRFVISSVLYRSTDGYTGKLRTGFLYFFRYFYFHIYFILRYSNKRIPQTPKRMPDNILPDRIPCRRAEKKSSLL